MNKRILFQIKKCLFRMQQVIIFKSSHISFGGKIALVGALVCFISLFFPWISSIGTIISSGNTQISTFSSFSNVLGRVGFIILTTLTIIVFGVFSIQKKEKLRYFSLIHISDYISVLLGSVLIFLFSIQSFFLIGGLQLFSSNIIYGKGITLCITGACVLFCSSFILKQEYRKNIKGSYINDIGVKSPKIGNNEEKNNMKLPF